MEPKELRRCRINTTNGRYYRKWWLEVYDGGSGQWLYACCDALAYIFVEVLDLEDYMGKEATVKWNVETSVVDISMIPLEELGAALRSFGIDPESIKPETPEGRLEIAIAAHGHGLKGRMWSKDGGAVGKDLTEGSPSFRSLRKEACEYAENNLLEETRRNHLLDHTIVNAMGQTAGGYMKGVVDLWDNLRRIKELGDEATPEQRLVLKMYQGADQTLGAGPIPKDIKGP